MMGETKSRKMILCEESSTWKKNSTKKWLPGAGTMLVAAAQQGRQGGTLTNIVSKESKQEKKQVM